MAPPAPPTPAGPPAASRHLPAAALVAIGLATYANGLANGFVWDDHALIVQGPARVGLAEVGRALAEPDVLLKSQPAPYYRPLTRVTFLADRALHGLDPLPYHLENLALHLAATLALFLLARRLAGGPGPAFVAALLFAIHPVNAETVNLVAARNNALVALFTLTSCAAYLRARESGSRRWLAGAAGLFLLAVASKETGLMLLPFLALHELIPEPGGRERARPRDALLRLAPLALVAAGYLAVRVAVLSTVIGSAPLPRTLDALARPLHIVPAYLGLVAFPAGLTIYHPEPESLLAGGLALACAWGAIAAAVVLLLRQGRPLTRFGLLWFAVQLVPVSGLVAIPSAAIAERYLYVPAIGLWLVVADQVVLLAASVRTRKAVVVAGCVLAAALAIATVRRNLDWRDDLSLFSSAARVSPRSTDASYGLGIALDDRGDASGAVREWERTLRMDPSHVGALSRLGTFHAERGELDAAAGFFARVVAIRPDDVETRFNLGLLLDRLGRHEDALAQYREFVRLNPVDYPDLTRRVRERLRAAEARGGSPARP